MAAQHASNASTSAPSSSTVSSHGSSISGASSGQSSSHDGLRSIRYSSNSSYSQDLSSFSPSAGSVGSGGSAGRRESANEGFQQLQNLNLGRNSISYATHPDFLALQPTYHDSGPSRSSAPLSYNEEYESTLRSPTFSSFFPTAPFYIDQPLPPQQLIPSPEPYSPCLRTSHIFHPPPPPNDSTNPPTQPYSNPYQ